jgi:tetratricopeptide (TPR) repeat protein
MRKFIKKEKLKNTYSFRTDIRLSKKKLWAFRIAALVFIPLTLFIGLELVLRISGFGYSPHIAIKQKIGKNNLYCYNIKMGWRFFPKKIAREFDGFAFKINKDPKTYRIFILGGSAAVGTPDPIYHFGRFLEEMLKNEYPQTDFEVINVAMTAINSHAVYQIAKSCAQFEPDLLILYMGNNEVVGPFGARTVLAPLSPSLSLIRANLAMTSTNTGQLFQSILSSVDSRHEIPQTWGGMEMFLEEKIRFDTDALQVVKSHFEQNLRDICNVGIKTGAKVVVSSVGCNLKDSPPFASLHRADLSKTDKQLWEQSYEEGIEYETDGHYTQAIKNYLAAVEIDETFADLQFRLGRCYWNLGEYSQAKERYIKARDYDALRFRADTQINKIISSVAEDRMSQGIYFVDISKAMEENSPHNIPGNELFYEHVHYKFEGNYILAKTLFNQIRKILPEKILQYRKKLPTLTLSQCEKRFMYTVFEKHQNVTYVLDVLVRRPPFTNQLYHDEFIKKLENEIDDLKQGIQQNLKSILSMYDETIQQYPHDWRLRWKLGNIYEREVKNHERASLEYEKILQYLPYSKAYGRLVSIFTMQNKLDKAEYYCRELIKMRPAVGDSYFYMGAIFLRKGEYDNVIKYLSQGIEFDPDSAIALNNLAWIYATSENKKIRDAEKAVQFAEKACTLTNYKSVGNLDTLAAAYASSGNFNKAINTVKKAIKIAKEEGQTEQTIKLNNRLRLYEKGFPYYEKPNH